MYTLKKLAHVLKNPFHLHITPCVSCELHFTWQSPSNFKSVFLMSIYKVSG